jgi:Rieske Fe-S protein
MDRRNFLAAGCGACFGGGALFPLFQGCASSGAASSIEGTDLVVPLSALAVPGGGATPSPRAIVIRHDQLRYPVCIVRFSETEIVALLMRCTHQGTELQLFGDRFECPAHGSEFDTRGTVIHGPAGDDLRTLPLVIRDNQLRISLQ